jgi:hypothetical protein
MKNNNLGQLFVLLSISIGLISCENNEASGPEIEVKAATPIVENYNPTYTGKVIEAVYNGNTVSVLEIEDGKYLFGGDVVLERSDIYLPGDVNKKGVYQGKNWPDRKVNFRYDKSVKGSLKDYWIAATNNWNKNLQFKFTEVGPKFKGNYILVQQNGNGSATSNSIGMKGGQQIISVDPTRFGAGNVIHEIGHAIGLKHEQVRNDRDDFIIVIKKNIQEKVLSNYEKCKKCPVTGKSYDFNSIMGYGSFGDFAIDPKKPTMVIVKSKKTWEANRKTLSQGDLDAVNAKYKKN